MTPNEQTAVEALKPCPFCGAIVRPEPGEFGGWIIFHECSVSGETKDRAIEAWNSRSILEASPTVPVSRWIPVTERLPTDGPECVDRGPHIHCWCHVDRWGCEHLAWTPYFQCWDGGDEDDVSPYNNRVTHWQPLPEAPQ